MLGVTTQKERKKIVCVCACVACLYALDVNFLNTCTNTQTSLQVMGKLGAAFSVSFEVITRSQLFFLCVTVIVQGKFLVHIFHRKSEGVEYN